MRADIAFTSDIPRSVRVVQAASLFDVPIDEKLSSSWSHELPIEDRDWSVGLIVGPSGGGKSVLARELWGEQIAATPTWSDRTILDDFPAGLSIKDITSTLTAVGLGSVPSWLKPHRVLSNGEQFRADMARAILSDADPIVVDEFTSVVDRQVAKIASHAVQKTIRRRNRRFVAVTCHYDVLDWLQPDWVYDVATTEFAWRLVQPHPTLRLTVHPATRADWAPFARHHYLSSTLHVAAHCFVAYVDGVPAAFTSYLNFMHPRTKTIRMAHRIVVLPDFQGLGIAARINDWCGQYLADRGLRYHISSSHPAMIRSLSSSPRWRELASSGMNFGTSSKQSLASRTSRRLLIHSFEYQPPGE